jgi:TIR domain
VPRVFISYRRDDAPAEAGRLHDNLADAFGAGQVFMDVVDLQPGDDFVDVIEDAVGSCDALVAVIGPRWLEARDPSGGRKIDDPDDWARLEIEASLERDVRVVPALVSGARMPRSSELPSSVAAFARRHALELSHLRWTDDVGRLVSAINRALGSEPPRPQEDTTPPDPTTVGSRRKKWSLGDTTFDGDWEEVGRGAGRPTDGSTAWWTRLTRSSSTEAPATTRPSHSGLGTKKTAKSSASCSIRVDECSRGSRRSSPLMITRRRMKSYR